MADDWQDAPKRKTVGLPKLRGRTWIVAVAAVAILILVTSSLHTVEAGERAVVFHQNGSLTTMQPGKFQFVLPVLNSVHVYNVQSQLHTKETAGISKDLQLVKTDVAVLYHPDPARITDIHQLYGPDYAGRVIDPAIQDAVKSAVSYWNAEELTASTRDRVKEDIETRVKADLDQAFLILDQLSITDFDFSAQFNAATEAKVVAQQKALEAKNNLERAKYEANQTVIQAQAQAEAARLLSAAASSEQGSAYLYLEWLKKWDGTLPQTLVGQDTQVLLPLQKPS